MNQRMKSVVMSKEDTDDDAGEILTRQPRLETAYRCHFY